MAVTLEQVRARDRTFEGLTLFALRRSGSEEGTPDYLTLDEALSQEVARVTELSERLGSGTSLRQRGGSAGPAARW